jgi:hypothetical protein
VCRGDLLVVLENEGQERGEVSEVSEEALVSEGKGSVACSPQSQS